jgi:hypothetical protein
MTWTTSEEDLLSVISAEVARRGRDDNARGEAGVIVHKVG